MTQKQENSAIHLGDGAYVHLACDNQICITANNHDPSKTDKAVYIEGKGISILLNWIKEQQEAGNLSK